MTPLRNPCQSASADDELHATEPKSGLFVPPDGAECTHKSMSEGVLYRTVLILYTNPFSITFQVLPPNFNSLEPDITPKTPVFRHSDRDLTLNKKEFQGFFYSCNRYLLFSRNLFEINI